MGKRGLAFAVVIVAAFVFLLGGFAFYFHINAPTKDAKYYRQQLTSRGWYGEQRAKKELVANPDKGIPILIEILSAERVGQAEACLSEIGDPAVPALLEALEKNKKNQFRFSVFSVFSFIALKGNASEKNHGIIVRFLANALSDKSLEVRREAALGFSIMGKAGAGALPELKNSLKDVDLGIRLRAANAICAITADRICVIPVLKEALDQDGTFAALG